MHKEITDTGIDSRWMALRILEGDDTLITALRRYTGYDVLSSEELNERLEKARKILEKQIHKEDLGTGLFPLLLRQPKE